MKKIFYDYDFGIEQLSDLARKYIDKDEVKIGLALLELNSKTYPDKARVYNELAKLRKKSDYSRGEQFAKHYYDMLSKYVNLSADLSKDLSNSRSDMISEPIIFKMI